MERGAAAAKREHAAVEEKEARFRSILELTRQLVREPSPAGSKGRERVLWIAGAWLRDHGLEATTIEHNGRPIALLGTAGTPGPGRTLCLNACADTAPVEDVGRWSADPFGGEIADGWMYGRGAADSKVAIAVFCHLLRDWADAADRIGNLVVLFDGDEHTGRFRGVQRFIADGPRVDAAMIGYPGLDTVRDGARGFWRATISVFGAEEHSGSSRGGGDNAVLRAAELVRRFGQVELDEDDDAFGLSPQLTVTGIDGGRGFSVVPDRCRVRVDIRVTPDWQPDDARNLAFDSVEWLDRTFPCSRRSRIHEWKGWPAYRLGGRDPVVMALRRGAEAAMGRRISTRPAGPSNIGNFLAAVGVPATCGFGVRYRGVHGVDECFETATVPTVTRAYELAIRNFFELAEAVD